MGIDAWIDNFISAKKRAKVLEEETKSNVVISFFDRTCHYEIRIYNKDYKKCVCVKSCDNYQKMMECLDLMIYGASLANELYEESEE